MLRSTNVDPAVFLPLAQTSLGRAAFCREKVIAALELEVHYLLGGYCATFGHSSLLMEGPQLLRLYGKMGKQTFYRNLLSCMIHMMTARSPNHSFHSNRGNVIYVLHERLLVTPSIGWIWGET